MHIPRELLPEEAGARKKQRIDLNFELMIVRCGIGCLENDIPMTNNDYVRLHLAMSRLGKKK